MLWRYKQKTSGNTGETVINVDWGKLGKFLRNR